MAAIRHALQRDVFTARDERLLGVVHVTKNGKSKSKKNNFLCLAVTSEQPVQVYICVVKKGSRNDELYKRHIQWSLNDLKKVEAIESKDRLKNLFKNLTCWKIIWFLMTAKKLFLKYHQILIKILIMPIFNFLNVIRMAEVTLTWFSTKSTDGKLVLNLNEKIFFRFS